MQFGDSQMFLRKISQSKKPPQPYGPSQPLTGIALPSFYIIFSTEELYQIQSSILHFPSQPIPDSIWADFGSYIWLVRNEIMFPLIAKITGPAGTMCGEKIELKRV
jgi:hypothetical protein